MTFSDNTDGVLKKTGEYEVIHSNSPVTNLGFKG